MSNRGARTFPRESGAGISTAVSLGLHAILIAAAFAATSPESIARREVSEIYERLARFLAPPQRLGSGAATREQLKFIALGDPSAQVRGSRLVPVDEVRTTPDTKISGFDQQSAAATMAVAAADDSVFSLVEVDSAATRYAWSAAPAYPQTMLDARKDGYVKAQWVVDELGYADTTTFKLIDWTSQEFANAVREALPFMRFSPAKMGDKVVKQLVQQDFTFRIANMIPVQAVAPKKP